MIGAVVNKGGTHDGKKSSSPPYEGHHMLCMKTNVNNCHFGENIKKMKRAKNIEFQLS